MKILNFIVLVLGIASAVAAGPAQAVDGSNLKRQAAIAEGRINDCAAGERSQIVSCVSAALANFARLIDKGDVKRLTPQLPSIVASAATGQTKASALSVIGRAKLLCANFVAQHSGQEKAFYNVVVRVLNKAQAVIQAAP